MSRVTRTQQSYDQELADSGRCRIYQNEYVAVGDHLAYVARERIIPVGDCLMDRVPWWKREKKKSKKR